MTVWNYNSKNIWMVFMQKIRDRDIREQIKDTYLKGFYDDPQSEVMDEFGIMWGESIVDIAVINGSLHAYEIKSEVDNLSRFSKQFNLYSKVFDYLNIITHEKNISILEKNYEMDGWGIYVVSNIQGVIDIRKIKKPHTNPSVNIFSLCHILWKDEAISILETKGIRKGISNKNRKQLYEIICENIKPKEIKKHVRNKIKSRIRIKRTHKDNCLVTTSK